MNASTAASGRFEKQETSPFAIQACAELGLSTRARSIPRPLRSRAPKRPGCSSGGRARGMILTVCDDVFVSNKWPLRVRLQRFDSDPANGRYRRNVTARPSIREGPLATPIPIFGGGGCALHSRPSSSEFPGAGDRGYPVETQLVAADQPWLPRGDTLMTAGPQQGAFGLGPVGNDRPSRGCITPSNLVTLFF